MATLEKIRSKSVLLFVIIIVALLAFILGDFLTSGRTYFGNGMTVAEAGSCTVDYNEYQNRINAASEQAQAQGQNVDNDQLSLQVINEVLFEQLLNKEYDDLGIKVTDTEISNALTGETPHRQAYQFIATLSQQIGLPEVSGKAVYDAMMNPAKYNLPAEAGEQLKKLWANEEADLEKSLLQEKFYRLVTGLFTANKIDAKALYDDNATTRHIAYATKSYSTVADKDVTVADADLQAAYEKNKAQYRLDEPTRSIDYIYVAIEPSQADRIAGQQAVENAIVALNGSEGTSALDGNTKFVVSRRASSKARITDKALKSYIDTATVGVAKVISTANDKYTIAKLLAVTSDIDSINVSMLGRADQGSLDSLLAQVNAGAKFADLIDGTAVQGNDSVWTSLAIENIPARIKEALSTGAIGQAFIVKDSIQGQAVETLYRINKRNSAVAIYDVAVAEYTVDPSNETLSKLNADLNTFIGANSSAEDFAKNAAAAGYTVMPASVTASSVRIGNATDSRSAVKWAMEAKKGQVMPIYQDSKQSYLLTLAVKNIYEGDYLPWDADLIADRLQAEALKAKKAEKLIAQYNGKAKDVAGYAKVMGTEAAEGDAVFSSPMLAGIGYNESLIQGAIAQAKKGEVVGPLQGNNAVVVFQVKDVNTENRKFEFDEYAQRYNQSMGIGRVQPMMLLLGKNKIENHLLDFTKSSFE